MFQQGLMLFLIKCSCNFSMHKDLFFDIFEFHVAVTGDSWTS